MATAAELKKVLNDAMQLAFVYLDENDCKLETVRSCIITGIKMVSFKCYVISLGVLKLSKKKTRS